MVNKDLVPSVDYNEFARNVFNPEWTGWKTVALIEKKCYPSRVYKGVIQHAICFLNNWFLEQKVKDYLNLDYISDDHERWYATRGTNIPDFKDKNGVTYELKQGRYFDGVYSIPDCDWHKCNVRLYYARETQTLYKLEKGVWKSLTRFQTVKHISPWNCLSDEECGIK